MRKNRFTSKYYTKKKERIVYCLNCDDIDDLAIVSGAFDIEQQKRRFQRCIRNGRFEGDICSRLFVVDAEYESPDLHEDDDETESE